jgi:hypothetical protein
VSFPAVLHNHQYVVPNAGGTGTGGGSGAADSVLVESLGGWADGPWALLGVSDKDGVLTGITVRPGQKQGNNWFEIDVRCGSTILATFKGLEESGGFTGIDSGEQLLHMPLAIAIAGIRAGIPIEARLRKAAGAGAPWAVAATFLVLPIVGDIDITTNPQRVLPSRAQGAYLDTAAWANSPTVELESSGDRYVTGIACRLGAAVGEIDIGTGDTVLATFATGSAYGFGYLFFLGMIAPVRVTGALRVRARVNGGTRIQVALSVIDAPLVLD